jgi:hypothetical protein
MSTSTATLAHTSSREADNSIRIARVAAAGRIAAERRAAETAYARLVAEARRYVDSHGQSFAIGEWDVDYCYICGRCTDHFGEHSESQIRAWREGTDIRVA